MDILEKKPKQKVILLGNEAIARGALEAGVQFVSTYPGTPASEIGNIFYKISPKRGNYFEFSVNEKLAMEAAMGSSFSGLKTLVAMKNFGLNVASDAFLPFIYIGAKGPTVIMVADDPSCHSSAQTEENTRAFAYLANLPVLEPSDPQECLEFTKLAFKISSQFKVPVMLRTTTRVSHQKMPVKMGILSEQIPPVGKFVKNHDQFVTMPPRVLAMKKELLEKIEKIRKLSEESGLNQVINSKSKAKTGIITSGVSYLYVMEALKELGLDLPVLKLGFFHPLPEKKINNFIKKFSKVLVVEELEPYLEKEVKRLAKDANCQLEVSGKDLLPEIGELKPETVLAGVSRFLGKKYTEKKLNLGIENFKRSPQLCPGCPYWLVFNGIKKAVEDKEVIFGGDIGCYMLAGLPPHFLQDYLSHMGSSIGIGHGIRKATNQKLISFIGDSTFFHAGIPALINTVFNKSNPLIMVLDNQTTAMTGHQPNPGMTTLKIDEIARACGVKYVKVIDPQNQAEFISTVKEYLTKDTVSVIIAKHPCKFAVR